MILSQSLETLLSSYESREKLLKSPHPHPLGFGRDKDSVPEALRLSF